MKLKFWKTLLLSGLSFLLISSVVFYPQLELPAPAGPYTVGRTVLRWVDAARPEVLTDDPKDFREVITMVWYPAAPETGVRAGYFPDISTLSGALVESGELSWWQVQGLRWIRSDNKLDAIPLKGPHPYPVVVFSPGNGTNIELYSSLASEIASHGYLVLGLNHPYDIPAVELSDGRVAHYDKEQWSIDPSAHQVYTAARMKVRTADMLFVLARLDDMNANGPFAGTLDLDLVAAAGHSLGGIAASEACKEDSRFRACLNYDGLQAGGPFSMDKAATPPAQPFMFLTRESQLHPALLDRFESMPESYWVVLHGASHQSFADGPVLQSTLLPGESHADRLMDLIQIYSLAFLQQTLRGQPAELLGASVEEQDISVKVFPSN